MTGKDPRWDIGRPYGEEGEAYVRKVLGWTEAHVEVKRKSYKDDFLYVELEQNPFDQGWRPSGLRTTKAELWAFVVDDTGIVIFLPTSLLRRSVKAGVGLLKGETDGECPTRGRLLRVSRLLQVPPS